MSVKGKRQRRGDETRMQLISATKTLLAQHDFESVTLDQIAAYVGVAKSSILWHFGSRDGLLTEAVFDLFEEIDAEINLIKEDLPTLAGRIDHLLDAVGGYFRDNPHAKGIVLALIFNQGAPTEIRDRIQAQWRQHIDEIQAFLAGDEGDIRREAAAGVMALLHGVYAQWYLNGQQGDVREMLLRYFHALHDDGGFMELSAPAPDTQD